MPDPAPLQTSVVIPSYNSVAFVGDAIASCFSEGVPEGQVIVVDDGSTDDTPRVLARFSERIRVHRKKNGGASKARNDGLGLVDTRYVIFLDADDRYEGGILGALEQEMERKQADLGLGAQKNMRANTAGGLRKSPPATDDRSAFIEAWIQGKTVGTNSQMWRAEFLRGIGGWCEDMKTLEEIEVVLRAVLSNARLAAIDEGHALYIDHGNTDRVSYGNSIEVVRSAVEGFVGIESQLMTAGQRRALGERYYNQARSAFRQGYVELGRDTLIRARRCGFRGHLGTRAHRLIAMLVGLERKEAFTGRWM